MPRRHRRGRPSMDHNSRFYPHHHAPRDSNPPNLPRGCLFTYRGVAIPAPYSYSHPRRGPLLPPAKESKIIGYRRQFNHRCSPRHPRYRTRLHSLFHRYRFRTLSRSQMDQSPAPITPIPCSRKVRQGRKERLRSTFTPARISASRKSGENSKSNIRA